MWVKPAMPGTIIRDPRSKRPLPDSGARVSESVFWLRRLRAGDVVRIDAPAAATRSTTGHKE